MNEEFMRRLKELKTVADQTIKESWDRGEAEVKKSLTATVAAEDFDRFEIATTFVTALLSECIPTGGPIYLADRFGALVYTLLSLIPRSTDQLVRGPLNESDLLLVISDPGGIAEKVREWQVTRTDQLPAIVEQIVCSLIREETADDGE